MARTQSANDGIRPRSSFCRPSGVRLNFWGGLEVSQNAKEIIVVSNVPEEIYLAESGENYLGVDTQRTGAKAVGFVN